LKKYQIITAKNLLIAMWLVVAFLGGFVFGFRSGFMDSSRHTAEIRNQMLDIKPYDASLEIDDLEYMNISPSGFSIGFNTKKTTGTTIYFNDVNGLVCEWTVYPSDIFSITDVKMQLFEDYSLRADIETYPEGGTVMFRIVDQKENRGSLWYYIDLPRANDTVLPPPYMPTTERE